MYRRNGRFGGTLRLCGREDSEEGGGGKERDALRLAFLEEHAELHKDVLEKCFQKVV